jgi:hypothetical protein
MTPPLLRIELDAFSGRSNPSWVLDARQSALVVAKLRPGAPCAAKQTDLGFRGFLIHNLAATPVRVWQGTIRTSDHSPMANLDSGQLEAHLIEMAIARGYEFLMGLTQ